MSTTPVTVGVMLAAKPCMVAVVDVGAAGLTTYFCEYAAIVPPLGVTHAPAASQYCVVVPPVGQVTTCELALL